MDHMKKGVPNNSSTVACVFVCFINVIPSRCLAETGGINFTELVPRDDRRDTHTDTPTDGRDL
jgi:hypothetical protein